MLPSIVELLKSLDISISKEWIYAGRPCSPRVLFAFESCPPNLLNDNDFNKVERLQHCLEDQIYSSLRKSYVITNISNNSLFAIPPNQEFVYVHRCSSDYNDPNKFLLNSLNKDCLRSASSMFTQPDSRSGNNKHENQDPILFRKFVFEHIRTALADGFNDNIGRTNVNPIFELPKASEWYKIFDSLVELFLIENRSSKAQSHFEQIKTHIDIDAQFSENRCKKILPLAMNVYQENLPIHYTKAQHLQRLEKAINLYNMQARGPTYQHYLKQLKSDCTNLWQNGRQLCEAVSLTGHPCIHELHKVILSNDLESDSSEDKNSENTNEDKKHEKESKHESRTILDLGSSKSTSRSRSGKKELERRFENQTIKLRSEESNRPRNLPSKSHNSNIITISASNCGEVQRERKDPFTLKEANFTFYDDLEATNHENMIKYEFQVYKHDLGKKPADLASSLSNMQISSQENQSEAKKLSDSGVNASSNDLQSTNRLLATSLDLSIQTDQFKNEIPNAYLTSMINSESPIGALPVFSSWSLVSIGKYSDYDPLNGLSQLGFLTNHNFLIPWDIVVSNGTATNIWEKQVSKKSMSSHKKSSLKLEEYLSSNLTNTQNSVTIRGYIGMEYECPLGHRFICSGPDRFVKVSSNGTVKDDAYKLVNGEMPLYTACPCRNNKDSTPYMAQMMRIFVVTPPSNINNGENISEINKQSIRQNPNSDFNDSKKPAKLNLGLRPRVQPHPQPCPIFFPSTNNQNPIILEENNIWVLRFPYIYMAEDGKPFYRPKDFETLNNCRILKGTFSSIVNLV